jgi:hypothetical protein
VIDRAGRGLASPRGGPRADDFATVCYLAVRTTQ